MDQGWKRLPLLVVFLLFWRNADGFRGGASSNAHRLWGHRFDTFSPRAVQSSVSEAHVSGILPVEEVGSSMLPNKPLESSSKFNLLQFVKGGSSSSQSTSNGSGQIVSVQGGSSSYPAKPGISGQSTSDGLHVSSSQEAPIHQSAEVSLPVFSQESISHSSSSAQGATSTSQSSSELLPESLGQPVSSQGEGSYSGLSQGASSQYTQDSNSKLSSSSTGDQSSPSLYSPSSQGSSDTLLGSDLSFLEEVAGLSPLVNFSSQSQETSSQLQPLLSSQSTNGQSSPVLHVVSPQSSSDLTSTDATSPLLTQGSVSYSSLSSQAQGSATSQGSLGAELSVSPVHSIPTQVGSDVYSGGVPQSPSASSLNTLVSLMSNKLDALPLRVSSQSTGSSSYRAVSQVGPPPQMGVSGLTSQGGSYYSRLLPQSQAASSQHALGYSKPISSPQRTSSQFTSVSGSRKQYTPVSQGSFGGQFGASTGFASGVSSRYGGSVQSQGTTSQFAPGSYPYASGSLSSPQTVAGPTAVQGSRKQFFSTSQGSSGAQFGASTGFASGVSSRYSGSVQSQGTTSQFAPGSYPYASGSLSSPQAGPSTTVQGSQKRLASTYVGSSGTQAGSSTSFTLQGSTAYGGSPQPQDTASQFAPGSYPYASGSLSSPQTVAGPTAVQGSRKQFTSTFTSSSGTQAGSSTPLLLQGSTAYGGSPQPQDTASQFAPGSSPYASVSLSSPQAVAGPTAVQGSRKQFISTSQGSSGAQSGASTGFASGVSSRYSGSVQSQGTASRFAPGSPSSYTSVSLSSPQAGPSTTVQGSQKRLASTYVGSSGIQAGSSTSFTLQGSTAYGGSPQPQDTASQFAPGSPSSYSGLSLSSPQAVAGPTAVQGSRKQFISTSQGSSGAQFGASAGIASQGISGFYSGSVQSQGTTSQLAPGSSPYASVSLSSPQAVAGPTALQVSRKQFTSTFTGSSSGTQAGSSAPLLLQGSTGYSGTPQDAASQFAPGSSSPYASVSFSSPQGSASQSSYEYQGSSGSQSQKSQRWQTSATRLTQGIQISNAAASQASSSSQSSPVQFSSLSSAGGSSSGVSRPFASAPGGSTNYVREALRLERAKYTPGSQLLPYDPNVASQDASSASDSEVLSSYSSMQNQNVPAQPSRSSSSSRFYSVKG